MPNTSSRGHGKKERTRKHNADNAAAIGSASVSPFLSDLEETRDDKPALGEEQIARLGSDQRDMLLVGWPENCNLTVVIADDEVNEGEYAHVHPAMYVISDVPGAQPAKITWAGRVGPANAMPDGRAYAVDRHAIEVYRQAAKPPLHGALRAYGDPDPSGSQSPLRRRPGSVFADADVAASLQNPSADARGRAERALGDFEEARRYAAAVPDDTRRPDDKIEDRLADLDAEMHRRRSNRPPG